MSNKKLKTLSQLSKEANNFGGKKGDGFDGTGYFPNKNLERSNKIEMKNKDRAGKIFQSSKKFKSTYEDNHKDGKMSMVPEKMVKHKQDSESGRISSNPKFINPDNIMRYIEESNMTISKQKITNIIRSEIKAAINELSVNVDKDGMIQEKTRGAAAPAGLAAASSISKGGFNIKSKTSVRGDTEGGTRSGRGSDTGGTGGRAQLSSKARGAVASAVSSAGVSRLADFTAAKASGGRNASGGKISAGYIANKSAAINKYNSIVNSKVSTLTSARNGYNSGTVMYVALNNLINSLSAKKTEYSAKWDYAQALYDDNGSAKTTARNAITAARTSQRQAKPVGVDPPPPPATPNHSSKHMGAKVTAWTRGGMTAVTTRWRTSGDMMSELYRSNNVATTGWDNSTNAGSYTIDGIGARDNWNTNITTAAQVFRVPANASAILGGLDAIFGNRRGTAEADARKYGWNGSNSTFVWYVTRV